MSSASPRQLKRLWDTEPAEREPLIDLPGIEGCRRWHFKDPTHGTYFAQRYFALIQSIANLYVDLSNVIRTPGYPWNYLDLRMRTGCEQVTDGQGIRKIGAIRAI